MGKSIEDLIYVQNVNMYELAFEQQYHYGVVRVDEAARAGDPEHRVDREHDHPEPPGPHRRVYPDLQAPGLRLRACRAAGAPAPSFFGGMLLRGSICRAS